MLWECIKLNQEFRKISHGVDHMLCPGGSQNFGRFRAQGLQFLSRQRCEFLRCAAHDVARERDPRRLDSRH